MQWRQTQPQLNNVHALSRTRKRDFPTLRRGILSQHKDLISSHSADSQLCIDVRYSIESISGIESVVEKVLLIKTLRCARALSLTRL